MSKCKLLRDLKHTVIRDEIETNFINTICKYNDAIRILIENDSKTQTDLEGALKIGLKRYNSWIVEKIRKEVELD